MVSDVNARIMMGASAGLTFRYVGLFGRFGGSWLRAALMAACTSRAAASILRFRSNWSTTVLAPSRLVEVISVTPAMRPNWRSSGVATAEAMVSGLAPGRMAWTWMTGNSTWGSGATGSWRYAMIPASRSPTARSEVPIGRLMKGAEMFMAPPRSVERRRGGQRARRGGAAEATGQAGGVQVDDRRRVERPHSREDEAADDGDAERAPELRARARPEGQGQAAQKRRHRRHHDGTEAQETGLVDRISRCLALFALRLQREVDHHDRVLLHDADQQDDADQRDDVQVRLEELKREDGADARRGQRRENGDGVDIALVEDAQEDVDGDERGEDEERLAGGGGLEGLRRALEAGADRRGQTDLLLGGLDRRDGMPERDPGRQVEG